MISRRVKKNIVRNTMKVRTRSRLILAAMTFIFLVALSFITQFAILDSFNAIEKQEMTANVQRAIANINTQEVSVAASCKDWANRDETYDFVGAPNLSRESLTLNQPVLLSTLDIDYLLMYDTNGTLIFSEGAESVDGTQEPVPAELDTIIKSSIIPRGVPGGVSGRRGMSLINDMPVMLAGYSIKGSNESAPSRGTLVMARLLTSQRVDDMESVLQLPDIRIHSRESLDNTLSFTDDDLAKMKKGGIISEPLDSNNMAGVTMITGIEDKPTFLVLEIQTIRSMNQQVQSSILIVAAAIILLSAIFIIAVQLLLQRFVLGPLSALDEDIKLITRSGDLSRRMPEKGDDEILSLTRSLNQMLDEIQENRDEISRARRELASRNQELEELNRKANLYLDIYLDVLTYEILNAIMGLRGYAEYLKDSASDSEKRFLAKIVDLAQKSSNVIRNVETISRIYKTPLQLRPVSLTAILTKECASRPAAHITLKDCEYTVIADDMLGVVFDNLFSNSLKFGDRDVEITVAAKPVGGDLVEISVCDNGPGIPDSMKPLVFDRFSHTSKTRSSYGLGLHIVKMLVDGYGGTVQAGDRIPGDASSGAAIRFTLRITDETGNISEEH